MKDLQEEHQNVPASAGIRGLLETLGKLLRKVPRLQEMRLVPSAAGAVITYSYIPYAEADTLAAIDTSMYQPYSILRAGQIEEFIPTNKNILAGLVELFDRASLRGLFATAVVVHPQARFWAAVTQDRNPRTQFFGIPVFMDAEVDPETVFVATAPMPGAELVDSKFTYKMVIE